jgi:hypothetical protein
VPHRERHRRDEHGVAGARVDRRDCDHDHRRRRQRQAPSSSRFDLSDRRPKINNEKPHAVLSFVQTHTMPSTRNVAKTDAGIDAISAILERDVQVTQPRRLLHIPLHIEIT